MRAAAQDKARRCDADAPHHLQRGWSCCFRGPEVRQRGRTPARCFTTTTRNDVAPACHRYFPSNRHSSLPAPTRQRRQRSSQERAVWRIESAPNFQISGSAPGVRPSRAGNTERCRRSSIKPSRGPSARSATVRQSNPDVHPDPPPGSQDVRRTPSIIKHAYRPGWSGTFVVR